MYIFCVHIFFGMFSFVVRQFFPFSHRQMSEYDPYSIREALYTKGDHFSLAVFS